MNCRVVLHLFARFLLALFFCAIAPTHTAPTLEEVLARDEPSDGADELIKTYHQQKLAALRAEMEAARSSISPRSYASSVDGDDHVMGDPAEDARIKQEIEFHTTKLEGLESGDPRFIAQEFAYIRAQAIQQARVQEVQLRETAQRLTPADRRAVLAQADAYKQAQGILASVVEGGSPEQAAKMRERIKSLADLLTVEAKSTGIEEGVQQEVAGWKTDLRTANQPEIADDDGASSVSGMEGAIAGKARPPKVVSLLDQPDYFELREPLSELNNRKYNLAQLNDTHENRKKTGSVTPAEQGAYMAQRALLQEQITAQQRVVSKLTNAQKATAEELKQQLIKGAFAGSEETAKQRGPRPPGAPATDEKEVVFDAGAALKTLTRRQKNLAEELSRFSQAETDPSLRYSTSPFRSAEDQAFIDKEVAAWKLREKKRPAELEAIRAELENLKKVQKLVDDHTKMAEVHASSYDSLSPKQLEEEQRSLLAMNTALAEVEAQEEFETRQLEKRRVAQSAAQLDDLMRTTPGSDEDLAVKAILGDPLTPDGAVLTRLRNSLSPEERTRFMDEIQDTLQRKLSGEDGTPESSRPPLLGKASRLSSLSEEDDTGESENLKKLLELTKRRISGDTEVLRSSSSSFGGGDSPRPQDMESVLARTLLQKIGIAQGYRALNITPNITPTERARLYKTNAAEFADIKAARLNFVESQSKTESGLDDPLRHEQFAENLAREKSAAVVAALEATYEELAQENDRKKRPRGPRAEVEAFDEKRKKFLTAFQTDPAGYLTETAGSEAEDSEQLKAFKKHLQRQLEKVGQDLRSMSVEDFLYDKSRVMPAQYQGNEAIDPESLLKVKPREKRLHVKNRLAVMLATLKEPTTDGTAPFTTFADATKVKAAALAGDDAIKVKDAASAARLTKGFNKDEDAPLTPEAARKLAQERAIVARSADPLKAMIGKKTFYVLLDQNGAPVATAGDDGRPSYFFEKVVDTDEDVPVGLTNGHKMVKIDDVDITRMSDPADFQQHLLERARNGVVVSDNDDRGIVTPAATHTHTQLDPDLAADLATRHFTPSVVKDLSDQYQLARQGYATLRDEIDDAKRQVKPDDKEPDVADLDPSVKAFKALKKQHAEQDEAAGAQAPDPDEDEARRQKHINELRDFMVRQHAAIQDNLDGLDGDEAHELRKRSAGLAVLAAEEIQAIKMKGASRYDRAEATQEFYQNTKTIADALKPYSDAYQAQQQDRRDRELALDLSLKPGEESLSLIRQKAQPAILEAQKRHMQTTAAAREVLQRTSQNLFKQRAMLEDVRNRKRTAKKASEIPALTTDITRFTQAVTALEKNYTKQFNDLQQLDMQLQEKIKAIRAQTEAAVATRATEIEDRLYAARDAEISTQLKKQKAAQRLLDAGTDPVRQQRIIDTAQDEIDRLQSKDLTPRRMLKQAQGGIARLTDLGNEGDTTSGTEDAKSKARADRRFASIEDESPRLAIADAPASPPRPLVVAPAPAPKRPPAPQPNSARARQLAGGVLAAWAPPAARPVAVPAAGNPPLRLVGVGAQPAPGVPPIVPPLPLALVGIGGPNPAAAPLTGIDAELDAEIKNLRTADPTMPDDIAEIRAAGAIKAKKIAEIEAQKGRGLKDWWRQSKRQQKKEHEKEVEAALQKRAARPQRAATPRGPAPRMAR